MQSLGYKDYCSYIKCIQIQYLAPGHLLLPVLDGELEPIERHPLSVLVGGPQRVVVEENLQLARAPRVVQQSSREVHHLLPQRLKKERFFFTYFIFFPQFCNKVQ